MDKYFEHSPTKRTEIHLPSGKRLDWKTYKNLKYFYIWQPTLRNPLISREQDLRQRCGIIADKVKELFQEPIRSNNMHIVILIL